MRDCALFARSYVTAESRDGIDVHSECFTRPDRDHVRGHRRFFVGQQAIDDPVAGIIEKDLPAVREIPYPMQAKGAPNLRITLKPNEELQYLELERCGTEVSQILVRLIAHKNFDCHDSIVSRYAARGPSADTSPNSTSISR